MTDTFDYVQVSTAATHAPDHGGAFLLELPAWMDRARCVDADPDVFFPGKGEGLPAVDDARRICATCAVRVECLAYALREDLRDGVFGGLSANQRRRLTPIG